MRECKQFRFFKLLFWLLFFVVACEPLYLSSRATAPVEQVGDWHSASVHCFFSPDDHLQEKLIALIDQEAIGIKAAIYLITDTKFAYALINACERGVEVQLVVDASQSRSIFSKIGLLKKHAILIFEYETRNELYYLMHNKFAIF